jgi:adenylate kinase family enzyme
LVLGTGAAGKSRLSREMAEILNLPLTHLDRRY